MLNKVMVAGVVESVDLEKRDAVVITDTPVKSKPVKVTIHMWKSSVDGDNPAWAGRPDWREKVVTGANLTFEGHMGNNGRIIAEAFGITATNPTNVDDCDDDDDCGCDEA